MLFENLKTSLELNRDAAPTIELAFRLANVLFKDIAQEAGEADIDTCPTGDIGKFLKVLKRQCYITETVCENNLETYSSYRAELEGYLVEITSMKKRCEELEAATAGTDDTEGEIKRLNDRLSEAERRKNEYNALLNKKSELEQRISNFCENDPAPLLSEIEALEKKYAELISEREKSENKKNELIAENEKLTDEKNRLVSEITALMKDNDTLAKATEIRENDVEHMQKSKIAAQQKLHRVEEALDNVVTEYKDLRSRYDSLSNVDIPEAERLAAEIRERVSEKESELDALNTECAALSQKKTDTENELDNVKLEKEELEKKLLDLTKSINDTNAGIAELERELSDITASGDERSVRLAEATKRLEYLEERRKRLCRSIEKTAEYLGVKIPDTETCYKNLLQMSAEQAVEYTRELTRCLREAREALLSHEKGI